MSGWGRLALVHSVGNYHLVFLLPSSPSSGGRTWLALRRWALLRCAGTVNHLQTGFLPDSWLRRESSKAKMLRRGVRNPAFTLECRHFSITWDWCLRKPGIQSSLPTLDLNIWAIFFRRGSRLALLKHRQYYIHLYSLEKVHALSPFFPQQHCYWFEMKWLLNFILNAEQQLSVLAMPDNACMVCGGLSWRDSDF